MSDDLEMKKEQTDEVNTVPAPGKEEPKGLKEKFDVFVKGVRHSAVRALPAFIVNNTSNILGGAHVFTEIIMFKASLKGGNLITDKSNPINYVVEPIKRVFTEAVKGSRVHMPDKGAPGYTNNLFKTITDTKAATEREFALQMKNGKAMHEVSLSNPWQTRSTLSGLTVWALSTFIPDKKVDDDEIERMEIKRRTNLPGYVAERFKQAVWVPEWQTHKRQMIGLGILSSGICSTLGSWRNREKVAEGALKGLHHYKFNIGYFGTSAFTFLASFPLLFASDDQRGYGGFGTLMTGRLLFLPKSLATKFKAKEPGTAWYTGGMVGFQLENWAQALIGGAEKKPDGTIVDHNDIRDAARAKAAAIKANPSAASETPGSTISKVTDHRYAMPERAAEAEQAVPSMQ